MTLFMPGVSKRLNGVFKWDVPIVSVYMCVRTTFFDIFGTSFHVTLEIICQTLNFLPDPMMMMHKNWKYKKKKKENWYSISLLIDSSYRSFIFAIFHQHIWEKYYIIMKIDVLIRFECNSMQFNLNLHMREAYKNN